MRRDASLAQISLLCPYWLDLLAVQETLKNLLQHHGSKASILRCSAFFIVQFSYPYMTTGKIIALTRWTFAGRVMSLLFNMLSRLVIAFLSRSKQGFSSKSLGAPIKNQKEKTQAGNCEETKHKRRDFLSGRGPETDLGLGGGGGMCRQLPWSESLAALSAGTSGKAGMTWG